MKRRIVLQGAVALLPSLAGCSSFSTPSPTLDVTVINHAETPYTVELMVFDVRDDPSRDEARVYDTTLDIEPDGETSREHIAEPRSYLVRYEAYKGNSTLTDEDHIHYYPPDTGTDDTLTFDIDANGSLTRR